MPEKSRRKKNTGLQALPWQTIFLYAALLAVGTLALQWLDVTRITRQHSFEMVMSCFAILFLALGIWLGMKLFSGHQAERPLPPGNPQAQAALGISEREFEVLQFLAAGLSNKEIARKLNISPNTIKTHVARLLEKLEARRRTQAIARARSLGLIHPGHKNG